MAVPPAAESVTPLSDGGYLSVRTRPVCTDLFDTACAIYRDVYETQNKAGAEADFDKPEGFTYDPVSQRFDPAFADELPFEVDPVKVAELARKAGE